MIKIITLTIIIFTIALGPSIAQQTSTPQSHGEYPGRTNHIHIKVSKQAVGTATTSQLYFPEGD